jgi:hypothetical protein
VPSDKKVAETTISTVEQRNVMGRAGLFGGGVFRLNSRYYGHCSLIGE